MLQKIQLEASARLELGFKLTGLPYIQAGNGSLEMWWESLSPQGWKRDQASYQANERHLAPGQRRHIVIMGPDASRDLRLIIQNGSVAQEVSIQLAGQGT